MIRVFLVDDHELVRRGITALLNAEADIEVVGEASTAAQARSRIRATRPDVAILDVRLPDGSGIDICRDVRSENPEVRCLILTGYDDDEAINAAVLAGAAGYVIKDVRGSGLLDSLRKVAAGRSLIDPALSRRVVERIHERHQADPRLASLSARERDILPLIAEGLTNREIGARLALAEKTVKNYISGLLSKLGLQRRTQAAILHLESQAPPT
jgi:DNA-binding NarL/FixJ family response regulator